jgi:UDP-glucose 4-epimerase
MTGSKILIVGGTGYLGRHLSAYLELQGYDLSITGSKILNLSKYYRILLEDKSTYQVLEGKKFDLIILLVSKLDALGTTHLEHPDLKINTTCYADFLQFIANQSITSKIIYSSSMTVYGINNKIPVDESGVIEPFHTYGLSKSMAETITSFFCRMNNIPGVIFRLPGIYGGDRKSGFIYNTIKKFLNNEPVELQTKGLIYWETNHIDDVCEMFLLFIQNYTWKNLVATYNLSYGTETDFYETARFIKKTLKSSQLLIEEDQKGYIPFYLSNSKVQEVIPVKLDFHNKLSRYIISFEK